jgi:protein-tyrosine phosphatase
MLDRLPPTARAWLGKLRTRPGRESVVYELRRRIRGEPALPGEVRRVVFICHGNICRSPFAERIFAAACPHVATRSAGLAASGGDPAQPGALRVAREHGIDLAMHRSTPLDADLVGWADLIVGMEGHHVREVERRWPEGAGKTLILGDFLADAPHWIDDPWGQPDDVFRLTFERIATANDALTARFRERESRC